MHQLQLLKYWLLINFNLWLLLLVLKSIFCSISPGLSPEGSADVVGEPDHGYFCISGPGDRTSHRVSAEEEAIRSQQASHLQHHDKEHPRAWSLSAHHHLHTALCWYGLLFLLCGTPAVLPLNNVTQYGFKVNHNILIVIFFFVGLFR